VDLTRSFHDETHLLRTPLPHTPRHHFTLLENTICWICVFAPERESEGPIIRRINKKVLSKGQASSASTAVAADDDDHEGKRKGKGKEKGKEKEKNNTSGNDHRCNCCGVSSCPRSVHVLLLT
jgi:hypothetical protein